jgi:hypothetical protein
VIINNGKTMRVADAATVNLGLGHRPRGTRDDMNLMPIYLDPTPCQKSKFLWEPVNYAMEI